MRVGWWSKWKFAFFLTPQFCHVHMLSCSLLQQTTSSMCVCMKDALVGVTAGLAESNGSLPLGSLLASSVCVCMKDALVELLRRTSVHFVHCLLPQHNAGLCDLRQSSITASDGGKAASSTHDDVMLNVPLVRAQVRGAQLVDAVRLHRQGTHRHTPHAPA